MFYILYFISKAIKNIFLYAAHYCAFDS